MTSFHTVFDKHEDFSDTEITKAYEWRIDHLDRMARMLNENDGAFREAVSKDFETALEKKVFGVVAPLAANEFTTIQPEERMEPVSPGVPKAIATSDRTAHVVLKPSGVALSTDPINSPLTILLDSAITTLSAGNPCFVKLESIPALFTLIQELIPKYFQPEPVTAVVCDEPGRGTRWYATGTEIDDAVRAKERARNENLALREQIDRDSMFEDIVGSSEALRKVLGQVAKVAPSDSTVLILGETGTGKELIARAIHKRSKRAERAFIGVNCAAIPPSLIASELFGYEKGAFTGAIQRRQGRFESANGGTIFLDEIGDFPSEIQVALLRVLQEREIERVGSNRPIAVDVRVLAATHRDLSALVAEGKFRKDLLYRLNVVPLEMPSLCERAADIPLLVEYFISRFGTKAGKKFRAIDKRTMRLFQTYDWPGNIRELQNVIERAVILSDCDVFSVDDTWLKRVPARVAVTPTAALNGALLRQEKEMIEAALTESHGRISGAAGAATRLGLPARTLDSKIKRLGINQYRFKAPQG